MSKKILKILVVVCVLCSVATLTLLPSSAAEEDISVAAFQGLIPANTYVFNCELTIPDFLPAEEYIPILCDGVHYEPIWMYDENGDLKIEYDNGGDTILVYTRGGWVAEKYRLVSVISPYNDGGTGFSSWFLDNTTLATVPPDEPIFPIYDNLYGIVTEYIYGGVTDLDNFQNLTATLFATLGSIFVLVLPFVIIFIVIKVIFGFLRW